MAYGAHFIEPHNEPEVVLGGCPAVACRFDIKLDRLVAAPNRAIKRENEIKEASAILTPIRQTAIKCPGEYFIARIVGINDDLQRLLAVCGRVRGILAEASFIDPNPVVKVIGCARFPGWVIRIEPSQASTTFEIVQDHRA